MRKDPILKIGAVCTDTTFERARISTREEQTETVSSEKFSADADSRSFEIHAPQGRSENSSSYRGTDSDRLSLIRIASAFTLVIISTLNTFGAASFKSLPYTDPFPPAPMPGSTNYCQPSASVILNQNLLGVTLPLTRPLPSGWQSGMGGITVEFWLKQKAFSQPTLDPIRDNPDGVIVHGPGFEVGANFMFGNPLEGGPGSIVATFSQTKGGAFLANRPISIALQPSDQQWHQYVLTYDLRTVRTYRDGELIDQKWMDNNTDRLGPIEDDAGSIFSSVLEIGSSSGPNSRRFNNGFLDSVRVSNIALNPWQVRRNFESARGYSRTLFVAVGASDAGAGTQGSPTSLLTALTQVGASTRIVLQPGTYNGADFQISRSASSKREHCLITGADGSAPVIISGSTPTLTGANYLYLRNLTFSSDSGNALNVNNSLGVTVDSCRISGSQNGIVANGSPKLSLQNCVVNVGNTGIQLINSPDNVVRNNTVVNGVVGVQFDAGANYASLLNNIMSGQSSASLVVNGTAQQRYRGNGNLYNPISGIAAILPGGSYSTAQVRDKSLAHAWYIVDTNELSDPFTRRGGYAAEAQSMAFAPVFVDPANGDFRLAPNLGNAMDAGAERTFQRTVVSPACDSLGAPRPQGNGCDVGAFESVGAAYAAFNLNADYTTSAGVYKPDGTLVKTLFSMRRMATGTNVVFWNGLDDNNQIALPNTYTIKMIAHNVQYVWENVVGNSSVPNTGESVHNGFEPIKAMTFNGTSAFYTSGYNEGHYELNRFDTSNPNKLTKIFGPKTFAPDAMTDVAADGANLFAMNSNTIFVYNQSDLRAAPQAFGTGGGNSHIEVQKNGGLLFVAKKLQHTIAIFNKATGVQTGSIPVNQPDDLSVTASGDLWVISGTSAIRYSVNALNGTVVQTIGGFGNPIAIACSPIDGTVLIADASTWQVKAFNSDGVAIWTHGQAGGFANGPRVTPDKFYWVFKDQTWTYTTTFLQFQPDGTWWVGDTFLSRSLHFNMSRQLLHEIDYQPHTYLASVDVNNGSRVFNRFTEYSVDYSKPPQQAWTITNFWGYNLPEYIYGAPGYDGICSPITMSNGRTYALTYDTGGGLAGWTRQVVELTATGLRETSVKRIGNNIRIAKDGSIYEQAGSGSQTYWRKPFAGFNVANDPQWGTPQKIGSANINSGYLVSDPSSSMFPLQTTNGTVVVYDPSRSTGYHLGGIKPGGNQWLWRAMPTFGPMDGCGGADSWVEYGGNLHMVAGRNVFAGFNGEFFQDAGQAGQFLHYYDNGLFVGQFGQPLLFGVVVNPPGGAGNNFAPALVEVGTNVFLYHNDEAGRGSHRWRATGLSDIRELAASVIVGQAPTYNPITNGTVPLPALTVTALNAAEAGATGAFIFARSGSTTERLTISFTVGGSATAGADYSAIGSTATFAIGSATAVVPITPVDDAAIEGPETVIATIATSANYTIGTPSTATATIIDNDSGSPVTVADLVVMDVSATPANPAPGQQVLFSATVKNQGTVATPAETLIGVGFYIDGGPVTSWFIQPSLAPGQTVTLTANDGITGSPFWTATPGNHTVLTIVDDVNRIGEVVETNNSRILTLPVGVTNATAPIVRVAPQSGQLKISWNSVAGQVYQVCYKASLADPTWTPLGSPITATSTASSYLDAPASGTKMRFYNVQTQ